MVAAEGTCRGASSLLCCVVLFVLAITRENVLIPRWCEGLLNPLLNAVYSPQLTMIRRYYVYWNSTEIGRIN